MNQDPDSKAGSYSFTQLFQSKEDASTSSSSSKTLSGLHVTVPEYIQVGQHCELTDDYIDQCREFCWSISDLKLSRKTGEVVCLHTKAFEDIAILVEIPSVYKKIVGLLQNWPDCRCCEGDQEFWIRKKVLMAFSSAWNLNRAEGDAVRTCQGFNVPCTVKLHRVENLSVRLLLGPPVRLHRNSVLREFIAHINARLQWGTVDFSEEQGHVELRRSIECEYLTKKNLSRSLQQLVEGLTKEASSVYPDLMKAVYLTDYSPTTYAETLPGIISKPEIVHQELCLLSYISSTPTVASCFDLSVELNRTRSQLIRLESGRQTLSRAVRQRSLKPGQLKYIIDKLMFLFKKQLRFKNFPGSYIVFYSACDVRIRGFGLSSLLDPFNSLSATEYKLKMQRGLNQFLQEANRANMGILSEQDLIDPSEFDMPIQNGEPIGRGGQGIVYKNTLNGQSVAIKLPLGTKESILEGNRRISSEYQCLKENKHPSVIRTLGLVKFKDRYGLVMEFHSTTLKEYYKDKRVRNSYDPAEAVEHLRQAAAVLEFIHSRGFSHYDIKPGNFFLNAKNQVVLADFGLARYTDCKEGAKPLGYTLLYASPEQLCSKAESFSKRSDVWSFGVMMFSLLLNTKPYEELPQPLTNKQFRIELTVNNRTPSVSIEFAVEFPELTEVMKQCWIHYSRRPSIHEVREKLDSLLNRS